jgi:hypothetical protein
MMKDNPLYFPKKKGKYVICTYNSGSPVVYINIYGKQYVMASPPRSTQGIVEKKA